MTVPLVTLSFACYGFFNAIVVGPASGLLADFGFDRRVYGTAAGLTNAITQIGGALSPVLFGLLLDTSGSYLYGWLMLGIVVLSLSLFPALLAKKGF
jgi:MFS family permease